ncbi:MAG: alkaline phosphatase family protein [Minicystis sp.]
MTRAPRVAAAVLLAGVLFAACSSSPADPTGSSSSAASTGAGGMTTTASTGGTAGAGPVDMSPPEWNKSVTPPADAEAAAQRAACGYTKGALPAETQGESVPMGKDIPVDTIVVLMMENRSFDHYFQGAANAGLTDIEVAPAGATNLDPDGQSVPAFHDTTYCFVDTAHGWSAVHQQINGGAMDGFVTSNDATHDAAIPGIPLEMMRGNRAMGYYEEADVPLMYWAAKNFAIGDHYHASVPGPTWPNRMYLYAASSFGRTHNAFPDNVEATLFDHLDVRGVPWRIYRSQTPCYAIFPDRIVKVLGTEKIADLDQFYADAAAGTLPKVVFIDAGFSLDDKDTYKQDNEHPPSIMEYGQHVTASVIAALTKSPQWKRSALFLTYDEHGGLYDHVPPPKACPPDDREPDVAQPGEGFDMLGIRVPFVVVSPFAKKKFVGHHVYDHTSIVRFIEARFTLPALSNRDANAEAPWEMFDFAGAPNLTPPAVPDVAIDPAKTSACQSLWAP